MTNLNLHVFEFTSNTGNVHTIAINKDNPQVATRNVGLLVDGKTFTWYDAAILVKQIMSICEFKGFCIDRYSNCSWKTGIVKK